MATNLHQIRYSKYKYGKDHWAISPQSFQEYGICTIRDRSHGHRYVVMLNPTSRKSYRLIVRLLNKPIASTHNRRYTKSEMNGLFTVLGQVADMLMDDRLIGQVYVLGNNSHSFDAETKSTIIGQEDEPSMLHGHVFYRGDPKHAYISNIPLEGKYPGFGIDVKSRFDDGIKQKIPWKDGQTKVALQYFKAKAMKLHNDEMTVHMIDNSVPFVYRNKECKFSLVHGGILLAVLCYLFYPHNMPNDNGNK